MTALSTSAPTSQPTRVVAGATTLCDAIPTGVRNATAAYERAGDALQRIAGETRQALPNVDVAGITERAGSQTLTDADRRSLETVRNEILEGADFRLDFSRESDLEVRRTWQNAEVRLGEMRDASSPAMALQAIGVAVRQRDAESELALRAFRRVSLEQTPTWLTKAIGERPVVGHEDRGVWLAKAASLEHKRVLRGLDEDSMTPKQCNRLMLSGRETATRTL